ncbi:Hypothetical predicted protein [Lecanosticta acicola]|uniref:Uncharacterized protein n=1 Tax=Lecanosticta acicola TaxID=111012 RepID=A0AAI8Z717_9PEZI|nr:Hypothetical predicted protein [Lecanosticta acicola]
MPIDITLPLHKYSYAPGKPEGPLSWTHLYDGDLFLLLRGDGERPHRGALTLQIVHATKVKEQINVGDLVDQAFDMRRRHYEAGGGDIQNDHLPIFGITKDSALAIRWKRMGLSDRIQLRLSSPAQCQEVKGVLSRRGMEFEERSSRPVHPDLASDRPSSALLDNQSANKQQSSPFFPSEQTTNSRSPFRLQDVEAGSLSHPYTSRHDDGRPPSSAHGSRARPQPPTPPRFNTEMEARTTTATFSGHSGNAQMPRSYTTPSQPVATATSDIRGAPAESGAERPSSSSQTVTVDLIRQAVEADESSGTCSPSRPVWSSTAEHDRLSGPFGPSSNSGEPRPGTAASAASATGSQMPPFEYQRDDSQRSSGGNSSRPSSSALALPDLVRPRAVENRPSSSARAESSNVATASHNSRPGSAMPQPRSPAVMEIVGKETQNQSHHPAIRDQGRPLEQTIPMDELIYGNGSILAQRSNKFRIQRKPSSIDAPHEFESPPPTARPSESENMVLRSNYSSEDVNTYRAYTASSSPDRGKGNEALLEKWHSQPQHERQAALEQFMVDNLENPLFTTLCEEIEGCWSRLSKGL